MACEGELSLVCRSTSRIAVPVVIDSKHDDLEEYLNPMKLFSSDVVQTYMDSKYVV